MKPANVLSDGVHIDEETASASHHTTNSRLCSSGLLSERSTMDHFITTHSIGMSRRGKNLLFIVKNELFVLVR